MKTDTRTLVIITLMCATCAAEDPATTLRQLIDDSIGWYGFYSEETSTEPMKPVIALRWPNNTRGSTDGATVLWIANGRPEAVAAIFPWEGLFVHEFDSLSRGTFVAKRDDRVVWKPTTAGLQFRPITDAPTPAATAPARLRQMKSLTDQFKATLLGWLPDNSQREELRIMSRPIYRYNIDKPAELQDGAIFAYATGTDPEAMLILEAFGAPGDYHWQYAFVRRTSGGLEGRFRNELVWTAEKYPQQRKSTLNHISFSRSLDEALKANE